MTSFSAIPSDIQRLISYRLSYEDILQFAKVNRTLYESIYNNQNFWKQLYNRDYQDILPVLPVVGPQINWRERYLSIGRLFVNGKHIHGKYKSAVFINPHVVLAVDIMDDLYRIYVANGDRHIIMKDVFRINTDMVPLNNSVLAIIYKLDGTVFFMDFNYHLHMLDGIMTNHIYIENSVHNFINIDDVSFVYSKDDHNMVSANFSLTTDKISDVITMEKRKEIIYFNSKYIIYRDDTDIYSINFVDRRLTYQFQPGLRPIFITDRYIDLDHAITDDNRILSIITHKDNDNIEVEELSFRAKAMMSDNFLGLDNYIYNPYNMEKIINQRVIYYDSGRFSTLKLYITA